MNKIGRLIKDVYYLGLRLGWRYWKVENDVIKYPQYYQGINIIPCKIRGRMILVIAPSRIE